MRVTFQKLDPRTPANATKPTPDIENIPNIAIQETLGSRHEPPSLNQTNDSSSHLFLPLLLAPTLRLRRPTSLHKHRIIVAGLRRWQDRGRGIFLVAFELGHELALDTGALVLPPGLVGVEVGLHFGDALLEEDVLVDFVGGLEDDLAPVGGECVGLLEGVISIRSTFGFWY